MFAMHVYVTHMKDIYVCEVFLAPGAIGEHNADAYMEFTRRQARTHPLVYDEVIQVQE